MRACVRAWVHACVRPQPCLFGTSTFLGTGYFPEQRGQPQLCQRFGSRQERESFVVSIGERKGRPHGGQHEIGLSV